MRHLGHLASYYYLQISGNCGYKPAHAQQAPLWGGTLKSGRQRSREEEGGTWELDHLNFKKSISISKLQTAALSSNLAFQVSSKMTLYTLSFERCKHSVF